MAMIGALDTTESLGLNHSDKLSVTLGEKDLYMLD